ncbi:MAG: glycosyltransferase family 39 protein [Flavobacteriales bacterium]|nr:glycosyltransferase family 39 protein [Flavobacteriales bacterium]
MKPQGKAGERFRTDLKDVIARYGKQTSPAHKRFFWSLILAGAALRAWLVWQPITHDEAAAYMAFATQDIRGLLSDYSLPGNHIFHTLLSKWSTGLFGSNVVGLRLPAFVAGVAVLPVFYLLVRSLFNRYIALMALAMAAGFPPLAELSAMAHGYSLSWLFLMLSFVLARHFVRENNGFTVILMGVAGALAMWSQPTAMFGMIMVYLWTLFSMLTKYDRSLAERLALLGAGLLVFLLVSVLLYLPVVIDHGADQLFRHASEGERNWRTFTAGYPDKVLELWMWIADPVGWVVAVLGFIGLFQATYVSAKYRTLLIALALGAIPLSLVLADAGDPWQWSYTVFFFMIGGAIGLFYLLKSIQDKLLPRLGKRTRTNWAALVLFLGFSIPGSTVVRNRVNHLPEAAACAQELVSGMHPIDRLCMDAFWEAPVAFELRGRGVDAASLTGRPEHGGLLFIVWNDQKGATPDLAIMRCDLHIRDFETPNVVRDWPRMEIFAARSR